MALSRPRYARHAKSPSGEAEETVGVTGHRHGHRSRSLMGSFGRVEIEVPRARLNTPEQDDGVEEQGAAGLSAAHASCRRADRGAYLAGTNTRRCAAHSLSVWRRGQQGYGEPVWRKVKTDWDAWNARSLPKNRSCGYSRRHSGARAARPQSDFRLAPCRPWRSRGRPEGAAGQQDMGCESTRPGAPASASHQARPAAARVPHRRQRAGLAGERRRLGRRAGPALHGSPASQSPRARPRAPARGDQRRLPRMIYAATRRCRTRPLGLHQEGTLGTARSPRTGKPAVELFTFADCRRANGAARARPMRSSGCTRSSNEGSRRRPCCRRRHTARCFLALLASGHNMRSFGACQRSPQSPSIICLTRRLKTPETLSPMIVCDA